MMVDFPCLKEKERRVFQCAKKGCDETNERPELITQSFMKEKTDCSINLPRFFGKQYGKGARAGLIERILQCAKEKNKGKSFPAFRKEEEKRGVRSVRCPKRLPVGNRGGGRSLVWLRRRNADGPRPGKRRGPSRAEGRQFRSAVSRNTAESTSALPAQPEKEKFSCQNSQTQKVASTGSMLPMIAAFT